MVLQQGSKQKRLPAEGVKVMRDVFMKGNLYPTGAQRADMLAKLHNLGFTWYKEENIKTYFAGARSKMRDNLPSSTPNGPEKLTITIPFDSPTSPQSAVSTSGMAISKPRKKSKRLPQFPSIRKSKVQSLAVLVKSSPDADQILINTWAGLMKADPQEVSRWRTTYLATGDLGLSSETAPAAPFTGDESDSEEEPLSLSFSQPKTAIPPPPLQPAPVEPPMAQSSLSGPTPVPVPFPVYSPSEQLLLAVNKALLSPSNEPPLPKSRSEFESLFVPYQVMMERWLENSDV
ncbi:hypothetical protein D9757_006141 [Collybiopsis confluens]|uniref:Uncharacterized protein n=1 Tax=Collybiopsis confluens TaxID=2823264 RepID=A0A8H5HHL5_9AGAR|nr:hypothetical protein D9757_006141 [Collybiopsis confluens]